MSSGADLFVVCKQCGSEVSPYITECPYCGHRLRRRAPKLPKEKSRRGGGRGLSGRLLGREGGAPVRTAARRPLHVGAALGRPYATITLVAISCALWVAWRGAFISLDKLVIVGPLHGDWWKLFTSQLTYISGWYAFATLIAIAIFGWLVERRHGPAVALAVFLGAGATGALAATAVYGFPVVSGGNGAALGLIGAWAVPDLQAARAGDYYEGDLLGTAAVAAVVLAMPLARFEASWLAGVTGGVVGLLAGLGLSRGARSEL